jgi:hypothetical protein
MDEKLETILKKNFDECLENFDFHKVKTVMDFLDWQWLGVGVPNKYQMIEWVKKRFKSCLEYLKDNNSITSGSGGFQVEIFKSGKVTIRFVLTDWESINPIE